MSTTTTRKLMTAAEFFDWANRPENAPKSYELVRGEVVEMTRPGARPGLVCVNVSWLLHNYVLQRQRGYVLSNDAGIILERDPDTVRGPDVVLFDEVVKYEELNPKFSEGVPTLAVEVLSPNDRIGKVTRRINEFLQAGIKLVWLVDPDARDVTVYRKDRNEHVVEEGQELTGEDVLPDLRIRAADFFVTAGAKPGQ
jgi:Uma2 family endonuclease